VHEVVKTRLANMQDDLSVEETLSVAELVDSDPVIDCLIKVNRSSW